MGGRRVHRKPDARRAMGISRAETSPVTRPTYSLGKKCGTPGERGDAAGPDFPNLRPAGQPEDSPIITDEKAIHAQSVA